MSRRRVAVLGGTFDPIHIGHLRSAVELRETLGLDELLLVPAHAPPLRGQPRSSAPHRLAMAREAIAGEPGLRVDGRELERPGPSYTVDTLTGLRAELGPDTALCFAMGGDAFRALDRWHDWRRVLELAHIVVLQRPGASLPETGVIADAWRRRRLDKPADLAGRPAGGILALTLTQLPVSATAIRALIAEGRSPRYLLADRTWDYIRRHGLYDVDRPQSDRP